jgi:hypothetical protein
MVAMMTDVEVEEGTGEGDDGAGGGTGVASRAGVAGRDEVAGRAGVASSEVESKVAVGDGGCESLFCAGTLLKSFTVLLFLLDFFFKVFSLNSGSFRKSFQDDIWNGTDKKTPIACKFI